jgi:hypothetical protein
MSVKDKKIRQVKYTIDVLTEEQLVRLPNAGKVGKHEQFELMHEAGRQAGIENEQYKLPRAKESVFRIPTTIFTNGWIYVLEDTELAFLLMIASRGAQDETVAIPAEERLLRYGIGRNAYMTNRMLERLKLITVTADPRRTGNGKIEGYKEGQEVLLHRFNVLRDGFDRKAFDAVTEEIVYQLEREQIPTIHDLMSPHRSPGTGE